VRPEAEAKLDRRTNGDQGLALTADCCGRIQAVSRQANFGGPPTDTWQRRLTGWIVD
jgi:hypothetical protein